MPTPENKMFIKPEKKAHVRDPERSNALLPAGGCYVPRTAYWLRRLAEGSVVKAAAPKAVTTESTSREDK